MTQSRRSHSSDSSDLSELATALRQLDLARDRLHQALDNLARPRSRSPSHVPPLSAPSRRHASPSPERSPPLLSSSDLRLGDRVQIRFPNPGQQNTGVVVGASRGGFLYVRTPNGDVIRRMPHNLRPL